MKRFFALLLCLCTMLCSCSQLEPLDETEPAEVTKEEVKKPSSKVKTNAKNPYGAPIYIEENEYQSIEDAPETEILGRRLTWENINSFPIKSEEMSLMERRMLCVNFFQFAKTALWIPDGDFSYVRNKKGTVDKMSAGEIYGGLPYIGSSTGNIYRVMDYMDEERGVVDMSEISKYPLLFGNQCSRGSYWGWARIVNSADFDGTRDMVASRGFVPVGPYTYDLSIKSFNEQTLSLKIAKSERPADLIHTALSSPFFNGFKKSPCDRFIVDAIKSGKAHLRAAMYLVVLLLNYSVNSSNGFSVLFCKEKH